MNQQKDKSMTDEIDVQKVAYGWIVTRNGYAAEHTYRGDVKYYRSEEAARKALKRISKAP